MKNFYFICIFILLGALSAQYHTAVQGVPYRDLGFVSENMETVSHKCGHHSLRLTPTQLETIDRWQLSIVDYKGIILSTPEQLLFPRKRSSLAFSLYPNLHSKLVLRRTKRFSA